MGDFKSKLPDLKELGSMTGKLFHDLKNSVCDIIIEYKKKRETAEQPQATPKPSTAEQKTKPKKETIKKETVKKVKPIKAADKSEGNVDE